MVPMDVEEPEGAPRIDEKNMRSRQLKAVLKKNFLVNRTSRRTCFCCTGWCALVFDMLIPVLFFLILFATTLWGTELHGEYTTNFPVDLHQCYECSSRGDDGFKVIFAPSDSEAVKNMLPVFAKAMGCARSDETVSSWYYGDFPFLFDLAPECKDYDTCISDVACYGQIVQDNFLLEESADSTMDFIREQPNEATAAVIFESDDLMKYSIRLNDSLVPGTGGRYNMIKIRELHE
ncbi:hypothetical protein BSKO_05240 [Bryopsis sp. KO-2023]|nr:hypothetical protein BSKO_05240 [Bryopsis sp. KO-2023]